MRDSIGMDLRASLPDPETDKFFVINCVDIVGDKIKRFAGLIGSRHGVPLVGPRTGSQQV